MSPTPLAPDRGGMTGLGMQRQGGIAGIAAVVIGAAAEVFERGVSRGSGMAATVDYFQGHAATVRTQTLLFVVGAPFLLWFLAGLRSRLRAADPDGSLAELALVAGAASSTLTLVALAVQEALTLETPLPALAALDDSLFLISGLPFAVVLVAAAVLTFTRRAFPAWIGWLSIAAAVTQVVPLFGMVAGSGPLAPGWLSAFLPYPLYVVWLAVVAITMTASREDRTAARPRPEPQEAPARV